MSRFTQLEANEVIAGLLPHSFTSLNELFRDGSVPAFQEIEGHTAGAWLARSPEEYWWANAFIKVFLNSPWARWSGKGFFTPYGELSKGQLGKGANLFNNRFRPVRYKLYTFIKKAEVDDNMCLTLRYPFGSLMYGLIDDVRKIDEGVFLGQIHFKFFWQRTRRFLGYFVLCALNES